MDSKEEDCLLFEIRRNKDNIFFYSPANIAIYKVPKEESEGFSISKCLNHIGEESQEVLLNNKQLGNLVVGIVDGCNMRCMYCYADSGTYGMPFSYLSTEDLVEMFHDLLSFYPSGVKQICFFGGEPLLAFDSIRGFVEYVNTFCSKNSLAIPRFSIVTNATLINDEIATFFGEYNFIVSVSLDGKKEQNDRYRVFKDSYESSYEVVVDKLKILNKGGITVIGEGTLMPDFFINYEKGSVKEFIDHFINLGFQNYFPFVAEGKDIEITSKIRRKVELFYSDFFIFWLETLKHPKDYYLSYFPTLITQQIYHICSKRVSHRCRAGFNSLFYGCTKKYYKCQMFYKVGNEIDLRFREQSAQNLCKPDFVKCKKCISRFTCLFWCDGIERFIDSAFFSNENAGDYIRCVVQNVLTMEILKWLTKLSQSQMGTVIESFQRIRENQCSLGSDL